MRTAEIAAAVGGLDVLVDDRLIEMQPGETHDDVRRRVWPAWAAMIEEAASGPTAVVAHGGVVTALLLAVGVSREILDDLGRHFDGSNPLPPGGAWEIVAPGSSAPFPRLAFVPSGVPVLARATHQRGTRVATAYESGPSVLFRSRASRSASW